MNESLGYEKSENGEKKTSNRRSGYSKKIIKTELGLVNLDIPRDIDGQFKL